MLIRNNEIKRKDEFEKIFLKLLKTKPLEKIYLIDIINMCNCSKNTFYKYFNNTNELYKYIEEKYLCILKDTFDSLLDIIYHKTEPQNLDYFNKILSNTGLLLSKSDLFKYKYRKIIVTYIKNIITDSNCDKHYSDYRALLFAEIIMYTLIYFYNKSQIVTVQDLFYLRKYLTQTNIDL